MIKSHHVSYLQQHSAVGVNIGPGVLGLALFQEHVGHNLVKLGNQLEHWVVGQVLQGKLALAGVTRVCFPQDSMAVAWHNLSRGDKFPLTVELCQDVAIPNTPCSFCVASSQQLVGIH